MWEAESPHPPPAPVGAGARLWVSIGAVWRCPGLQQGQRRPEASPARRKAFWSGRRPSLAALQAAANLGAVGPQPPHAARGVLPVLRTAALPLAAPPLTTPPNRGKLIVRRRVGIIVRTIEKRAANRESGALLFSLPLLSGSYVQEGAPCAGGAPRPRNPLPPSLFGGWARKVKKLYRAPVSATGPQRGPAASRTERALRAPSVRPPGAARPNAPARPCGAAVRALAPPVKKARPSPSGAARPCLFSGAAAPRSFPAQVLGAKNRPRKVVAVFWPLGPKRPARLRPAGGRAVWA